MTVTPEQAEKDLVAMTQVAQTRRGGVENVTALVAADVNAVNERKETQLPPELEKSLRIQLDRLNRMWKTHFPHLDELKFEDYRSAFTPAVLEMMKPGEAWELDRGFTELAFEPAVEDAQLEPPLVDELQGYLSRTAPDMLRLFTHSADGDCSRRLLGRGNGQFSISRSTLHGVTSLHSSALNATIDVTQNGRSYRDGMWQSDLLKNLEAQGGILRLIRPESVGKEYLGSPGMSPQEYLGFFKAEAVLALLKLPSKGIAMLDLKGLLTTLMGSYNGNLNLLSGERKVLTPTTCQAMNRGDDVVPRFSYNPNPQSSRDHLLVFEGAEATQKDINHCVMLGLELKK